MDAEGRGQPIPKLPEELVLAHVIPRLPWHTRPVCRTLSKSWRALIDTRNPELDLRTRTIQLPLLRDLFLFCISDNEIFISDPDMKGACRMNECQVQPHWRKLPPVPLAIRESMVASSGMVYVCPGRAWADGEDGEEQLMMLKLDIGCAYCTWKKCSVPYFFNADAVTFNGSIYVPRISTGLASPKTAVLVHDMSTDTCKQVEKWVPDELRVLSRSTDSWRTWEEVPLSEFQWSHLGLVKLLNAECFEPVPETVTNLIWIDYENEVLSWFSSSVRNSWVYIDYTTYIEGMCVEQIKFIRGSMYAIFSEQKDDVDDGKEEEEDGMARKKRRTGRAYQSSLRGY